MTENTKIRVDDLDFFYGRRQILKNVQASFEGRTITAVVGPSGAGKSTLLLTLNRLWEDYPGAHMRGRVLIDLDGQCRDIYAEGYPVRHLRRRVAMVFQKPNPLPMSIYRNVAFPLRMAGRYDKHTAFDRIEQALKMACLWEEVKDRLGEDARKLSGGQQQRLCIARVLTMEPEVLLMDEPTSSLDHGATEMIESLLVGLKPRYTILMVSHDRQQVARVADRVLTLASGAIVP